MATEKHHRDESTAEIAEPPRKKSKNADRNGERIKDTKDKKDKKSKKEKRKELKETNGVANGGSAEVTNSEIAKVTEQPDVEIPDAPPLNEEPSTTEANLDEDGAGAQKKSKKEKKDKKEKKEKKAKKKSKVTVEDIGAADSPDPTETEPTAGTGTPEANGIEEVPRKKSKKEKTKSKKDKKSKTLDPDTDGAERNGQLVAEGGYTETEAVKALSEADVSAFLDKHSITVSNPEPFETYRPITAFSHLPSSKLLSKSPFAEYKEPTPIQAASWPYGLAGRDIIGVAETGSGKTIAFALPCVQAVLAACAGGGDRKKTRAVIVSPTRELAMQTHEQVKKLCSLVNLSCVCVYGGASKDDQRAALNKAAAVVVATPGRLKDFLANDGFTLDSASFVVLDEADRMLDKGFEEDIKLILSSCAAKEKRQTLMFTATWPLSVQALASTFMSSPVKIAIGRGNGADASESAEVKLQANERIKQEVEVVDHRSKEQWALQIIKTHQAGKKKDDRILVFCLYKKEAVRVETFLSQRGVRVCSIHGDLKQDQRTRSLEAFKQGKTPVLVATDVAARGLDIPEVKLVLNVTFPLTIEDYVHRIGRTGRAGKQGHAITLFTEHDRPHSGELINILKAAGQPVPEELMKFGTTVKKKGHDAYGAFYKNVDPNKKATKITFD